jgi:hypothetical protein
MMNKSTNTLIAGRLSTSNNKTTTLASLADEASMKRVNSSYPPRAYEAENLRG